MLFARSNIFWLLLLLCLQGFLGASESFAARPSFICLRQALKLRDHVVRALNEHQSLKRPGRLARLAPFKLSAAEADLQASARMLYFDKQVVVDEGSRAFAASNEFDWFKIPLEQAPIDAVVGFGTNSAWDIALRRKARTLVIADWDMNPLIGQEYIMRPLLALAETPADFVSLLAGVPIGPQLKHRPVAQAFEQIDNWLKRYYKHTQELQFGLTEGFHRDVKTRAEFLNKSLARLAADARVSDMQLRALHDYYQAIHLRGTQAPSQRLGPIEGYMSSYFAPQLEAAGLSFLYKFFRKRYDTNRLIERGADPALVHRADFSVLASQASFDYLKQLFVQGLSYARASYDDPALYQAVLAQANKRGQRGFTFSLSNIIDCLSRDQYDNQILFSNYQKLVQSILGQESGPLYIMRVRGLQDQHQFEVHDISNNSHL